jgi:hypothetical protein
MMETTDTYDLSWDQPSRVRKVVTETPPAAAAVARPRRGRLGSTRQPRPSLATSCA